MNTEAESAEIARNAVIEMRTHIRVCTLYTLRVTEDRMERHDMSHELVSGEIKRLEKLLENTTEAL